MAPYGTRCTNVRPGGVATEVATDAGRHALEIALRSMTEESWG
jgi:hypothetical protein